MPFIRDFSLSELLPRLFILIVSERKGPGWREAAEAAQSFQTLDPLC